MQAIWPKSLAINQDTRWNELNQTRSSTSFW